MLLTLVLCENTKRNPSFQRPASPPLNLSLRRGRAIAHMDQILTYIKDPGWWFSAFFVAIIASVVAGFAKDRIGRWASTISERSRERYKRRTDARAAAIEALAQNEGFLLIAMARAAVATTLCIGIMTLFILSPMWAELLQTLCATLSSDPSCGRSAKAISLFSFVGFGLLAIFVGFNYSSLLSTTMSGYRAYRKQRGFPAVR